MFKVNKGFEGMVSTKGYLGLLSEAPQSILEHLYHAGHPQIIKGRKAKKNKAIDNAEGEPLPEAPKAE